MPRPLIAVTDSPFPSLDPAKAALARIDPELRVANSASAEDILAVGRDADAILCISQNGSICNGNDLRFGVSDRDA